MMGPEQARAIIGFPDTTKSFTEQSHALANRGFIYLGTLADAGATQEELVEAWTNLVLAIQAMRPEWTCSGPHKIKGGAFVFKGTQGYLMAFRPNGKVLLGKSTREVFNEEWAPHYTMMMPLSSFLSRIKG